MKRVQKITGQIISLEMNQDTWVARILSTDGSDRQYQLASRSDLKIGNFITGFVEDNQLMHVKKIENPLDQSHQVFVESPEHDFGQILDSVPKPGENTNASFKNSYKITKVKPKSYQKHFIDFEEDYTANEIDESNVNTGDSVEEPSTITPDEEIVGDEEDFINDEAMMEGYVQ